MKTIKKQIFLKGYREIWVRYKRSSLAVAGLVLVFSFTFMALFAPLLTSYEPFQLTTDVLQAPSLKHIMGTDDLGRDMFSGVAFGARVSLIVGIAAAATSAFIGTLIGGISGYFGKKIDDLLMRITELFQVIPMFFLILILVTIFRPNIWNIIFVIGILAWPGTARLVRAEFLSLKEREFVEASKSLGASEAHILFKEILPNAIAPIIVNTTLLVGSAILIEAGVSFLGLGDPNLISWGFILNNAQRFLRHAWWMAFFPGISIFLTVLGLNLIGDGLNDALNPRLR